MQIPPQLRYSSDHEWAERREGAVRVGITDYAQDALGDVVFVDPPTVGLQVNKGEPIGEVESTKSVSEIYAPIGGTVVAVNKALSGSPELVNQDPYGGGWICEIRADDEDDFASLLDAAGYAELTAN